MNSMKQISKEIKKLSKQKITLESEIDELLDMRLSKEITPERFKQKSAVKEVELLEVKNHLYALEERLKNSVTAESVETYLRSMLDHAESTDDEILKNLYDNFVDKIVIDNERVDVSLIVRPFGRVAYKQTSGQPHVLLHANYKRTQITE